jgi:uncharacterized protein YjbI with pentapeptide repeats
MRGSYAHGAVFRGAILGDADLRGTDLSMANLRWVNLKDAKLRGADLSSADLTDAETAPGQLTSVKSLEQATMPDVSRQRQPKDSDRETSLEEEMFPAQTLMSDVNESDNT